MPLESSFSIDFPSDRDYIPYIQDFLRDYLKCYDFSKKFSEHVAEESVSWFNSVIPEEKFLYSQPMVFFSGNNSEDILSIQIRTSDKKEFLTSISAQNFKEA